MSLVTDLAPVIVAAEIGNETETAIAGNGGIEAREVGRITVSRHRRRPIIEDTILEDAILEDAILDTALRPMDPQTWRTSNTDLLFLTRTVTATGTFVIQTGTTIGVVSATMITTETTTGG
jgi:hypothetical protein